LAGVAKAWQLTTKTGKTYEVCQGLYGPECSCPDWIFVRSNTKGGCKHCAALQAASLL
jgi:hypothetical protein